MAEITEQDFEPYSEAPPPPPQPLASQPSARIPITTGRPEITVHPRPKEKEITEQDFEPYDSKDEKAKPQPYREVSPAEAAARGFINIATYGLAPALYGAGAAGAAGKTPEEQNAMIVPGTDYPGGEMVGAGLHQQWNNHFGNDPNPETAAAYQQGAQSFLSSDQAAQDQHYVPYVLGQIGAALSAPETLAGSMMRAGLTKFLPQLLKMAGLGAVQSAAQSTGQAISEGRPEDIPAEAAKGAVTGGVLGLGGGIVTGAVSGLAGKVGQIVRGARTSNAEAGRKVVETLRGDVDRFGPSMTPEEHVAAREAGLPLVPADFGGERTRALFRSGANISPEGRQVAQRFVQKRFEQQNPRIAGFIRRLTGGADKMSDQDVVDAAKATFNKPAYQRAYQAGDRPIWSPEIERLVGDPDMLAAIGKAIKTGKSWAIFDGLGGFNPSVRVTEDGQLIFNRGPTGVPTYPNIQFWDYVQRELRGARDATSNSADRTRLTNLRRSLLKDLDQQVPEFGRARQTAANFFGAEDAIEAGEKFVMSKSRDFADAARALNAMKPIERELFARSFASDLASRLEDVRDRSAVINQAFLDSPSARAKINLALGPDRANQLEALLRVEEIADQLRQALGNSTTVRQASEAGMAGGTAAGAAESLKHTTFLGLLMTGLGIHKGAKMLAGIDEKVARRVVEMLVSDDLTEAQKAIQIVSKSQIWMDFLRRATGAGGRAGVRAGVRVGAPDIGFTNLMAGATVGAEDLGDLFKKKEHEPHPREPEPAYQDNSQ